MASCNSDSNNPQTPAPAKVQNSDELSNNNGSMDDSLTLKIIEKSIPTPMDSLTAYNCLDLMKTIHGLNLKLNNSGESLGLSDEQMELTKKGYFVICENGIELFEESRTKLPKNLMSEFDSFKKEYEKHPVDISEFTK
jgi:hypothetical protein